MRAHLRSRARASSISAVLPPRDSADFSPELERAAAAILYRTPIPSKSGHTIYVLNSAALPDSHEVNFDSLLPYVLARLPGEDELVSGREYEVVFFAGGNADGGATAVKKNRPSWAWFVAAYNVLSRAMRKRIQRLYIVHEKTWVRVLAEMFSTIASPKFRRKIVHAATLTSLAQQLPIQELIIPPSAYLLDRKFSPDIHVQDLSGKRAFGAKQPFPRNHSGASRLPRVLRETTTFILMDPNVTTEGLFRIPPNARYKDILREAYDRGQKYVIWKEGDIALPQPHYENATNVEKIVADTDVADAYGVHLAAGICKSWYAELRQPLFPHTSYAELRKLFGDPEAVVGLDVLRDLVAPNSEWSALPPTSREILTRHLLPMLSAIAAHKGANKMSPENLAVCFAPTLLCGPDQIEDARMSTVLRRILSTAVTIWDSQLREACGIAEDAFRRDLQAPSRTDDYEDPLHETEPPGLMRTSSPPALETQRVGIILKDNDATSPSSPELHSGDLLPPPLPPRSNGPANPDALTMNVAEPLAPPPLPSRAIGEIGVPNTAPSETISSLLAAQAGNQTSVVAPSQSPAAVRRKPAPSLTVASTAIVMTPHVTESPATYAAPTSVARTDGFEEVATVAAPISGVEDLPTCDAGEGEMAAALKRKPLSARNSSGDTLS